MRRLLVLAIALALAVGCSAKRSDQKFFEEMGQLSKEDILARGDALFAKKKYEEARKYYSFLADSFPNDPAGRRAAIKVADTFYQRKDVESLTEAQLRYRDFSNRYPNDPNRPYALVMLGKCSFQQSKGPLRDLTPVREALTSFRQVVELYPDSPYTAEARELLSKCIHDLAEHEFEVGNFYFRIHAYMGAKQRFQYLIATYPDSDAAQRAVPLLQAAESHLVAAPVMKSTAEKTGNSDAPRNP